MKKSLYITTTLPYVNAEPHIGFALEIIQADVIARWHKLMGEEVVFNFGTDEHGQKIYQKALERGIEPQQYCDEYAAKFDELKKALNLSYNKFIRTTDEHHVAAAQEFWKICMANGYIYKKKYQVKYCVGCELEKTDSELVDGRCPLHPNRELELRDEDNYFFKFSQFQKPLLDFYEKNPDFVKPEGKYKEIKTFVEEGLEDFSVSRLKSKMPWGIDVPNDPEQVMYVWFDALINYISTIGWPDKLEEFDKYWPGIQVAGKDNLRQQTAMWQAMLIAAGLPNSKQVFIHGFLTVNGQKMSKSLGNVINPVELASQFGTDALRYYLLAKAHPWEDSDITIDKVKETYNADLANGLGNLVARVAKLAERESFQFSVISYQLNDPILNDLNLKIENYRFDEAMKMIWEWISKTDQEIEKAKPWTLNGEELKAALEPWANEIAKIATALQAFLPETAEKILSQYKGPEIKSQAPMFPRLMK